MPRQQQVVSCSLILSWLLKRYCRIAAGLPRCISFITGLLIFSGANADAIVSRNLTLCLDGAKIEQLESVRNGYLEINLPSGADKDSLRIAPGKAAEILRVLTAPRQTAKNIEKELNQFSEREELLQARLKALSVREEIFKAAAKSQSAKAPRRTKTDPEPLTSIKKGTDYAFSQLEAVYQIKRKTEKELAQIAERRSRLKSEDLSGGAVVRVWVTPASASVTVSWRESGRSWKPHYQIRAADNGSASVSLMAQQVLLGKGEKAHLLLAPMTHNDNPATFSYVNEWATLLKEEFKVNSISESPYTFSFTNSSRVNFPPGEMSCFKNGVYVGKGYFQGANSGSPAEIICSSR